MNSLVSEMIIFIYYYFIYDDWAQQEGASERNKQQNRLVLLLLAFAVVDVSVLFASSAIRRNALNKRDGEW